MSNMSNINNITNQQQGKNQQKKQQQQELEYAKWQKVDDRYVVYRVVDDDYVAYQRVLDSDEKYFGFDYFVADLHTHEISDMTGPNKHSKKTVDLDDEENICITCKACHGHLYSYGCACSEYRKPKPGVSQQELDAIHKQTYHDLKIDLKMIDQYHENSLPVLCPHAVALLTVLRRKRDNPSIVEKEGEYTGQWTHTFVTNGGRKIPIEVVEIEI
jgi:hypothetical protein